MFFAVSAREALSASNRLSRSQHETEKSNMGCSNLRAPIAYTNYGTAPSAEIGPNFGTYPCWDVVVKAYDKLPLQSHEARTHGLENHQHGG